MKNICILGSGSWGTALGIHLAKMGHNIKIWSYVKEEAELINKERKCKFLPEVKIPDNIFCTTDFEEAINDTSMILIVTPSKAVRQTIQNCKKYITNQQIVICSKGFEKETLYTLNEIVEQELPNSQIGGLSRTKPCRRGIYANTYSFSNCFKKRRTFRKCSRIIYE